VPDDPSWFASQIALKRANSFGCWGFGFHPEVCADAFRPGYGESPADGSPRFDNGDRVVRGGAAELYPWQDCGEWQLLLSAMRTSTSSWEFQIHVRPALSVVVVSREKQKKKKTEEEEEEGKGNET
jgi:hypothetical protein